MRSYVIRRAIGSLAVLFGTITLIFGLTRVAPGDPAATILGAAATPEAVAKLNHDMGLDRSLPVQYLDYLADAVRGDFGESYYSHLPALDSVLDRLPVTAELAFLTMTVSIFVALGLAIATVRFRRRWFSRLVDGGTLVGLSIPTFWSGLLLLLLFGLYWPDIVPAGGWVFFSESPIDNLRHCVLPVLALSIPTVAILFRSLRSSMKDVLHRDYITYARAGGIREARVIRKVAVPNAVVPTATVAGLLLGYMLGGSLIIETIFSIPGLGQLVVLSLQRRDFPVATVAVSFVAFGFIVINFLVDVFYAYLNPRVRELYSRKITMSEA